MTQDIKAQDIKAQDIKTHATSASKIKTLLSFTVLMIWTLFVIVTYSILKFFKVKNRNEFVALFHRGILRCFNIKVKTVGLVHSARPTLYISNHISYIDIFVLGSKVPGTYIAKSEVAKWPLFGFLAKLQDTLFIERRSRKVGNQIEQIQRHLLNVCNLILFPEGTSDYGTYVAPFHSSFFQSAFSEDNSINIQPITVAYTHYNGERMDRPTRDNYAWYKPRKILPHFSNGLGLKKAQASITFHTPVKLSDFDSRKDCSNYCENVIRQGLLEALNLDQEVKDQST